MGNLTIKIQNKNKDIVAARTAEDEVSVVYNEAYQPGDYITVVCNEANSYLMVQLDDAIGQSFVFVKEEGFTFEVPFDEKKSCYSPKSFSGTQHLLFVRMASEQEIKAYKNVCLNKYDQHGAVHCFPHASANVETRGESVFAAKNAINGNRENHLHGVWPYESWGINMDDNAKIKVEFGRKVVADHIKLTIRADFPHDNWWQQVTLNFSDGSTMKWELEKTDKAQSISFDSKTIEWIEMGELIKAEDPSPFPALTQLEVYGYEA